MCVRAPACICLGWGFGESIGMVEESEHNDVLGSILGTALLPIRLSGICYPGKAPRAGAWRPSARR